MKKIADISHYQGSINWTEARKELSLVIFRASVGMKQDQKYLENASACGIPYGVYHYVKAGTAEEAEQEARFFVESANRAAGKPLFYIADIEYKAQTAATTEAVCVAFLETLQKLGVSAVDARVLAAGTLLLFAVSLAEENGKDVRGWLAARALPIRWAILMTGVLAVLLMGVWGSGFSEASFIYFNF